MILLVKSYPYHFVRAILFNTILSVDHFVHTILSVPFYPLPFCPRTPRSSIFVTAAILFLSTVQISVSCWQPINSIYLSIYGIYIAPLQGNYSEALPAQTWAKIKVLRSL